MADKKTSDLGIQSEESREAALRRAPQGTGTATGVAAREHFEEIERPEGENRGSKREIAGGDNISADFAKADRGKPTGLQAEEAAYTVNGTIPPRTVPSPSGPVPVSAVAGSKEDADQRTADAMEQYDKQLTRASYQPVDDEVIERASAAELRAAAYDRGYDLGGPAGAKATRARFRRAQEEDKTLKKQARKSTKPKEEEGTGNGQ